MESLDILHPINAELLSPKYYFQSLVEQACYCGLLSDKGLSAIQTDLLLILAEQTDKWSQGKSSSIPTEKAQLYPVCDWSSIKIISNAGTGHRNIKIGAFESTI